MMRPIETIEQDGMAIELHPDEDCTSPRKDRDGNVAWMVCSHRRLRLGDEEFSPDDYTSWSELRSAIERTKRPVVILPLFLLDHSGLALQTRPFREDSGGWDSGQVGWVYVTRELANEHLFEQGKGVVGEPTDEQREQIVKALEAEVEEYGSWLAGECYGFIIRRDGRELDACWGFIGYEHAKESAIYAAKPYAGDKLWNVQVDRAVKLIRASDAEEAAKIAREELDAAHWWADDWTTTNDIQECEDQEADRR